MVGNPFGPAGTGKTESVKALGGLLGRLVLVFNCDEVLYIQIYKYAIFVWNCLENLFEMIGNG